MIKLRMRSEQTTALMRSLFAAVFVLAPTLWQPAEAHQQSLQLKHAKRTNTGYRLPSARNTSTSSTSSLMAMVELGSLATVGAIPPFIYIPQVDFQKEGTIHNLAETQLVKYLVTRIQLVSALSTLMSKTITSSESDKIFSRKPADADTPWSGQDISKHKKLRDSLCEKKYVTMLQSSEDNIVTALLHPKEWTPAISGALATFIATQLWKNEEEINKGLATMADKERCCSEEILPRVPASELEATRVKLAKTMKNLFASPSSPVPELVKASKDQNSPNFKWDAGAAEWKELVNKVVFYRIVQRHAGEFLTLTKATQISLGQKPGNTVDSAEPKALS